MKATYSLAMKERVYPAEGGYTNHPDDPGGPTNWGITLVDARKYWKPDADAADVRAMPKSVADAIYWPKYAVPMKYEEMPAGYDFSLLDFGINSGVARSQKYCMAQLGAANMNDAVVKANATADKVKLIKDFWAKRLGFLKGLGTFKTFGRGWTDRCVKGEAWAVKAWLTFGTALAPSQVKTVLKGEEKKATTKSTAAGTGAGATGAGAGATPTQVDVSHDWMIWTIAGIFVVCLVVWLGTLAYVHWLRANAYKEVAEAT